MLQRDISSSDFDTNMRRLAIEQADQLRKLDEIYKMATETQSRLHGTSSSRKNLYHSSAKSNVIVGAAVHNTNDSRRIAELETLLAELQEADRRTELGMAHLRQLFATPMATASHAVPNETRAAPALLRQPFDDIAIIHIDGISTLGHNTLSGHDTELLTQAHQDTLQHYSDFPAVPILVCREIDASHALAQVIMNDAPSSETDHDRWQIMSVTAAATNYPVDLVPSVQDSDKDISSFDKPLHHMLSQRCDSILATPHQLASTAAVLMVPPAVNGVNIPRATCDIAPPAITTAVKTSFNSLQRIPAPMSTGLPVWTTVNTLALDHYRKLSKLEPPAAGLDNRYSFSINRWLQVPFDPGKL